MINKNRDRKLTETKDSQAGGFKPEKRSNIKKFTNASDKNEPAGNSKTKWVIGGVVVGTLVISIVLYKMLVGSSEPAKTTATQPQTQQKAVTNKVQEQEQIQQKQSSDKKSGDSDSVVDKTMPDEKVAALTKEQLVARVKAQDSDIRSLEEQVKLLNGDQKFKDSSLTAPKVPPFKVSELMAEKAYLDYTKYYESTGKGSYEFWLDAVYHGINYKIPVPYKVYKDLDHTGIIMSEMEYVMTDKGEKIITAFKIKDNVKDLMK